MTLTLLPTFTEAHRRAMRNKIADIISDGFYEELSSRTIADKVLEAMRDPDPPGVAGSRLGEGTLYSFSQEDICKIISAPRDEVLK